MSDCSAAHTPSQSSTPTLCSAAATDATASTPGARRSGTATASTPAALRASNTACRCSLPAVCGRRHQPCKAQHSCTQQRARTRVQHAPCGCVEGDDGQGRLRQCSGVACPQRRDSAAHVQRRHRDGATRTRRGAQQHGARRQHARRALRSRHVLLAVRAVPALAAAAAVLREQSRLREDGVARSRVGIRRDAARLGDLVRCVPRRLRRGSCRRRAALLYVRGSAGVRHAVCSARGYGMSRRRVACRRMGARRGVDRQQLHARCGSD